MIENTTQKLATLFNDSKEYLLTKANELNKRMGGIALYIIFTFPNPQNTILNKCITPILNYTSLPEETKKYMIERIDKVTKQILILTSLIFLTKKYPSKVVFGCILGAIFPVITLNTTNKFWKALFYKKLEKQPNDLKANQTKVVWIIGQLFNKIQPALITATITYLTYPIATEVLPVAFGARLTASGLYSDFFLKLTPTPKFIRHRSQSQ